MSYRRCSYMYDDEQCINSNARKMSPYWWLCYLHSVKCGFTEKEWVEAGKIESLEVEKEYQGRCDECTDRRKRQKKQNTESGWRCAKCDGADLPKHFRLCSKGDVDGESCSDSSTCESSRSGANMMRTDGHDEPVPSWSLFWRNLQFFLGGLLWLLGAILATPGVILLSWATYLMQDQLIADRRINSWQDSV